MDFAALFVVENLHPFLYVADLKDFMASGNESLRHYLQPPPQTQSSWSFLHQFWWYFVFSGMGDWRARLDVECDTPCFTPGSDFLVSKYRSIKSTGRDTVYKEMESMPLLKPCRAQQSARFWVSVRRGLLIFFWMMFAALTSLAVVFLVRAYEPPPPSVWHQRRVICRNTAPAPQSDVARRIQAASALGCGGLILAQEEVNSLNLRRLVTEGKQYGVSIILEVPILEDYDCHQLQRLKDAARSWLADGASGFYLLGGGKATVIMISQILQNEVEIISGEERLILLPDWLCDDEDMPKNKSQVLRTCPLTDWNLQKFTVRSEMKDTAWEVMSGDTDGLQLRQFLAITLPGTIILSLNQSQPLPSWLSFLLILRFQTPDLYTGWLQIISDGSSYRALSHWGCSTLLVIIGCYDQSQNVSLRLPHFSASARLLLSTKQQRSPGQVLQDSVQLLPGEAQLLRLTPD